MPSNVTRKHCPTCPVSLVCMAGRLKILWRCAVCAKLKVETVSAEGFEDDYTDIETRHAQRQLVACDVDLPILARKSVMPRLCAECYATYNWSGDALYWRET